MKKTIIKSIAKLPTHPSTSNALLIFSIVQFFIKILESFDLLTTKLSQVQSISILLIVLFTFMFMFYKFQPIEIRNKK